MKKKIFWFLGIFIFLLGILVVANWFVKNRIQNVLENEMRVTSYGDLDVNLLLNKFSVEDIAVKQDRFSAVARRISARGLSYYEFLSQNKIELEELEVLSPHINLLPADTSSGAGKKGRDVLIKKVILQEGIAEKKLQDSSKATFYARFPQAVFRDIRSGVTVSDIKSYEVQLDSIFLKMNSEHYITVDEISAVDGEVQVKKFKIESPFPPEQFDQKIPHEKDRITLNIPKIHLDSLTIENLNDSLYFQNPRMAIADAQLNIYRNKLLKDGTTTRPLYNELLRKLPFKLNFSQIVLNSGEIIYEERVKAEDGRATVRLAAVNAEVKNLHNVRSVSVQPQVTGNADLMRGTPVNLELSFPVFDPQNNFRISGNFGRLKGEALDPFLVPSLNLRARGIMESASFNFNGSEDLLRGNLSIDYQTFEIELLGDSGEEKQGFLSSIANLFVDNKKEPDDESGQTISVKRDKMRSFWNFVWRGLLEGLRNALGQF